MTPGAKSTVEGHVDGMKDIQAKGGTMEDFMKNDEEPSAGQQMPDLVPRIRKKWLKS